tara:strand:- start:1867 stop:2784 length:918 start_codon:yes stop_codon:yes gene_type:complete
MKYISILGIYVADLVFFGNKIPIRGETVLGEKFVIGPGGKGSNQAIAAAKAGGKVNFISKIGNDQYGQMALKMYKEFNINSSKVLVSNEYSTGAAGILVNKMTGENAINVVPGAAGKITKEDIDQSSEIIKNSSIFLTQLEPPIEVVEYAIEVAKSYNITTILNPAPAVKLKDKTLNLIDYFTPNETEASFYVNHKVETKEEAKQAANKLLDKGIKNVIITLGEKGAYFANNKENFMSEAFVLKNKIVDTTGAGDAFNAGLAVALTENKNIEESIRFANAVGALSTTKIGTAKSMPLREEIDNLV